MVRTLIISMEKGVHVKIYTTSDMVSAKHIKEIDKQLQQLGSKVSDRFMKNDKHILANVLSLACGDGTNGITIEQINSIKHPEFEIECDCRHATLKKH